MVPLILVNPYVGLLYAYPPGNFRGLRRTVTGVLTWPTGWGYETAPAFPVRRAPSRREARGILRESFFLGAGDLRLGDLQLLGLRRDLQMPRAAPLGAGPVNLPLGCWQGTLRIQDLGFRVLNSA